MKKGLTLEKRLALYLRDGMACAWCGAGIEEGAARLTLDHLVPYSQGGSNEATNLVTCCTLCNSRHPDRNIADFATGVAAYLGLDPDTILAHIDATRMRTYDTRRAKEIIRQRGGWAAARRNPTG